MIFNFFNIKKNKMRTKKKKTNIPNLKKQYKIWLGVFVSLVSILLVSPIITGESYDYINTELGEVRTLTQNTPMKLINKEWNPNNGLLRIDMEIQDSLNNSTLTNIQYEAMNRYVTDHSDELDYDIFQVNPRYIVMLVRDLPEGFDVLGVGINPSFIEPEIESDTGMEDRAIQYYFYEEEMKINTKLIEKTQQEYQTDWLSLRQEELKERIEDNENQIRLSYIRIGNTEQSIKEAQQDEQYLTEEELTNMTEEINNYENNILTEENNIEKLEEEIESWETRIDMYETQKNDLNGE